MLRTVAATKAVTPQMLENTWKETEYHLVIFHATKGAHVGVVLHAAVMGLQIIQLF
jgi:hypothetical protein